MTRGGTKVRLGATPRFPCQDENFISFRSKNPNRKLLVSYPEFPDGDELRDEIKMGKGLEEKEPPVTGPHRVEMNQWISCSPFERLLNITIVEACDGRATLTMPFLIDYAQGAGLMHGGALVSLADTAVVMAIKSIIEPLSHFATTELESRFLLPVTKGIVTAQAEVVSREGGRIDGKAILYDEEGRAVMDFCSTFKVSRGTRIK